MDNLRDRGYPSAKNNYNRSSKKKALMTSDIASYPFRGSAYMGETVNQSRPDVLSKLVTAYNSKAFGNPNAPLMNRYGADYVTNDDERAFDSGIALSNRDNNRLGYINKDVRPGQTTYSLGVDNLPFGGNMYDREITTPLGNIGLNYDGDGTASLNYQTSPNVYYLQALAKALLSRGSL